MKFKLFLYIRKMETTLKLISSTKPYIFRSLGVFDDVTQKYYQSSLFPKKTEVELTSGKFPMTNYMNTYSESKKTHVIGGKTVRIVAFVVSCEEGMLNEYGNCEIIVVEDEPNLAAAPAAGGRRKSRSRRFKGKRSKSRK
jgi:hypothetical protein